jgi:hypothetical protein
VRRSVRDGAKGPHRSDGRWLPLADPMEPKRRRWLRVRQRVSDPKDLAAYVDFAPQDTMLEDGVRVAGTRWTIESGLEPAKSEVGARSLRGAQLDRLVSADHARHVGVGSADSYARGDHRGGGGAAAVPARPESCRPA